MGEGDAALRTSPVGKWSSSLSTARMNWLGEWIVGSAGRVSHGQSGSDGRRVSGRSFGHVASCCRVVVAIFYADMSILQLGWLAKSVACWPIRNGSAAVHLGIHPTAQ